jgi:hypothetical protein
MTVNGIRRPIVAAGVSRSPAVRIAEHGAVPLRHLISLDGPPQVPPVPEPDGCAVAWASPCDEPGGFTAAPASRPRANRLDPGTAGPWTDAMGAKAAALALARRAGLPALPGYVVPAALARPALRAGAAAIRARGAGAGRRVVLGVPLGPALAGELGQAVVRLGGRVIVRSSSPLEHDPRWSGAFSSIAEVGPGDIGTAVRSVWASAFAAGPLGRLAACGMDPAGLELAVLIQPEISPASGGIARVSGDEVTVEGVAGHPAAMLSGWADGAAARVRGLSPAGDVRVPQVTGDLPRLIGSETVMTVVRLAQDTARALGGGVIEWAADAGGVYLLQSLPAVPRPLLADTAAPHAPAVPREGPGGPNAYRLAASPAVAGHGAGRLLHRRPHESLPRDGGDIVLLADHPVPALAPLLFAGRAGGPPAAARRSGLHTTAVRGIISRGGPASSHLSEVARALGIPMVVRCDPAAVTGQRPGQDGGWLAAVDGSAGQVTLIRAAGVP